MKDIANNDIYAGDFVKILYSDWPNLVGMVVKVVRSDTPDKIKVDFSDRWSGYFLPHEVVKYNDSNAEK